MGKTIEGIQSQILKIPQASPYFHLSTAISRRLPAAHAGSSSKSAWRRNECETQYTFTAFGLSLAVLFPPIAAPRKSCPSHRCRPPHAGIDDPGLHLQKARRAEAAGRRCAEHPHHPDGRRRPRDGLDLRRRNPHADAGPSREAGDLLQSLSLDGDVFADARALLTGRNHTASATARSPRSRTTLTATAGPFRSHRRRSPKC